mgnify:FL=1|jgi:hypothetical protein
MGHADVIVDVAFLQYGKHAPSNSGFKGIVTTESVFGGFVNYLVRDKAISNSMDDELVRGKGEQAKHTASSLLHSEHGLDGSLMDYTSRETATKNSNDKAYFTMTNEGKIYSQEQREEWIRNSMKSFSKDGDLIWTLVVSLDNYDLLNEYELKTQEDFASTTQKALNKTFKKIGLDPKNMIWWEDFHTNTDHPHMHITFLEKEHTRDRGKFTEKEIDKVKTTIITEIAARKRYKELYLQESEDALKMINPLKKEVISQMETLSYKTLKDVSNLYSQLPRSGRLQYNSANIAPYKKQLDNIVEQILKSDSLKESYKKFADHLKTFDENMNAIGNEKISHMFESEDSKLRTQIANEILRGFKEVKQDLSEKANKVHDWKMEHGTQLLRDALDHIWVDDLLPEQKIVVQELKEQNFVAAQMAIKNLGSSAVDQYLKGSVIVIASKEDAEKERGIEYLHSASEQGNKQAKKFMNFFNRSVGFTKNEFHGYRQRFGMRLPKFFKRMLNARKKEVEEEIDEYLKQNQKKIYEKESGEYPGYKVKRGEQKI